MNTFEAEFGDFKIVPRQARITASPTEENEFFVLLFDLECDIRNFFASPSFPKGKACVREYIKIPPKCPNCNFELQGHYELKESGRFEYNGVTIAIIPSYNEDIIEFRFHYETVEYKLCYLKETN